MNNFNKKLSYEKKPKIYFKIKSFHLKFFEKPLKKILAKLEYLNIKSSKVITLPRKNERYTVLRSPHIDKKSREQFEMQSYTKLLVIEYNLKNIQNLKYIVNYITNTLSGCILKITYINK